MTDNRPPLWKVIARWGIPVGILCAACGYVARNLVPGLAFTSPGVAIPLAAGGVLFLFGIAVNADWLWSIAKGRKFLIGVNVWAMVILSIVLLAVVNAIVAVTPQTDGWFVDVTRNRVHTLSEQTRNILKGLDRDIKITVLLGSGTVRVGYGNTIDLTTRVSDLLRLYAGGSSRVKAETIDTYVDKTRADMFAARFKANAEPDTIVVEIGERNVQIPFRDLIDAPPMDYMNPQPDDMTPGFKGEEKITAAIVSLSEDKQSVVYFVTGHGEFLPEGAEGKALSRFSTELRRDNYRIETLNLETKGEIPADCSVLVIAGPTASYKPIEAAILRKYLEGDGKLLLLVRPRAAKGTLEGLEVLLSDFNIDVADKEVVIEVYRDLVRGTAVGDVKVIVQDYAKHPITDDITNLNCYLQGACPVKPLLPEPPPGPAGVRNMPASPYIAVQLLRSGADSWGETNLAAPEVKFDAGQDEKGPLPLALAITKRPLPVPGAPKDDTGGARIVAVGSTTIAADVILKEYEANRVFLMNSVNWLAKKETKLGIPPSKPDRNELRAGPMGMKLILLITVVIMPLAAIFAGLLVWFARRHE